MLQQAQTQYHKQANTQAKRVADQVTSLITAAKIAQDNGEFMQCLDKSGRTIILLDSNTKLSVKINHQ